MNGPALPPSALSLVELEVKRRHKPTKYTDKKDGFVAALYLSYPDATVPSFRERVSTRLDVQIRIPKA